MPDIPGDMPDIPGDIPDIPGDIPDIPGKKAVLPPLIQAPRTEKQAGLLIADDAGQSSKPKVETEFRLCLSDKSRTPLLVPAPETQKYAGVGC
ncbi:MAG: hypothetical protein LBB43_00360 [Spirochaetaceae bacterium]|jgi:hypothetical protein|nr:hypothetical protein [Spirochaetaceae bacterium]